MQLAKWNGVERRVIRSDTQCQVWDSGTQSVTVSKVKESRSMSLFLNLLEY